MVLKVRVKVPDAAGVVPAVIKTEPAASVDPVPTVTVGPVPNPVTAKVGAVPLIICLPPNCVVESVVNGKVRPNPPALRVVAPPARMQVFPPTSKIPPAATEL